MAETMQHKETGAPVEVREDQISDYLNSGDYTFSKDVGIMIEDEAGNETAYQFGPSEAEEYISSGRGRYASATEIADYKEHQTYGQGGYMIPAALLGVANSASMNLVGTILDAAGMPIDEIERQNPATSLLSHLATDVAAMTLAAPIYAPAKLAKAGYTATKAAKTAAEARSAKSLWDAAKTLPSVAKNLPWHRTLPGQVALKGAKVKKGLTDKLLKNAAEDTLESAGSRGLLASMGGMAYESFLFSAGYGISDAVDTLYKNRENGDWNPMDAVWTLGTNVGFGTVLGAAIPPVFKGLGYLGVQGLGLSGQVLNKVTNWTAKTGSYDDFMEVLSRRGARQAMDEYGEAQGASELKNIYTEARNVDEVLTANDKIVSAKQAIFHETGQLIDHALGFNADINILDNEGHAIKWIKEMLEKIPSEAGEIPGIVGNRKDGGASTTVLATLLTEGNARLGGRTGGGGVKVASLLDTLEDTIIKTLTEGTLVIPRDSILIGQHPSAIKIQRIAKRLQEEAGISEITTIEKLAQETGFRLESSSHKELLSLFEMISNPGRGGREGIRDYIERWVGNFAGKILTSDDPIYSGPAFAALRGGHGQNLGYHYENGNIPGMISVLMGHEASRVHLDSAVSARVFSDLEKLGSATHLLSMKGSESSVEALKEFRKLFKEQINKFLTSDGEWIPNAHESTTGLTAWGVLAGAKAHTNSMMTTRDGLYKQIAESFMEEDPLFRATRTPKLRPSIEKIGEFVKRIDHTSAGTKLEELNILAKTSRELLERLTDPDVYQPPNLTRLTESERSRFVRLYKRKGMVSPKDYKIVPPKQKGPLKGPGWIKKDPLLQDAADLVRKNVKKDKAGLIKKPSLAMLQRGLKIGSARARKIREALREEGVWGMTEQQAYVRKQGLRADLAKSKIQSYQNTVDKAEAHLNALKDSSIRGDTERVMKERGWNIDEMFEEVSDAWKKQIVKADAELKEAQARLNKVVEEEGFNLQPTIKGIKIPKEVSEKYGEIHRPQADSPFYISGEDEVAWKARIGWEKLDWNSREAARRRRNIEIKYPADSNVPIVQAAVAIEKALQDQTLKLTGEVGPAMRMAAILQQERNTMQLGENPAMLPYIAGMGLGALTGEELGEGGFIPGAVVGAAAVGGMRFSQDSLLNPNRAIAKLITFFNMVNGYEEFTNMQVKRYVRWLNYAKETKAGDLAKKVTYVGPGSEIRFPRLFVSNAIAQTLSGGEDLGEDDLL